MIRYRFGLSIKFVICNFILLLYRIIFILAILLLKLILFIPIFIYKIIFFINHYNNYVVFHIYKKYVIIKLSLIEINTLEELVMYKINDFKFDIIFHNDMNIPINMKKFEINENNSTYQYDLYITDQITIKETSFQINKSNIKISINNDLEKRYLFIEGYNQPYALYEELDNTHACIYLQKDYVHMMNIDTMFVSLLALERRMYQFNHFILHSSFVLLNGKAILFTAPSGTGKSTQADLWNKYRNTRTINGDRTLIVKEDNTYYACGWPICGSSEICFNEKYPISCIVVLSQGKENTIVNLEYKEAFKKLLSEITINYHNSDYVNKSMDFIDDLLKSINIYHLSCTISEDAVLCLENKLKEDNL